MRVFFFIIKDKLLSVSCVGRFFFFILVFLFLFFQHITNSLISVPIIQSFCFTDIPTLSPSSQASKENYTEFSLSSNIPYKNIPTPSLPLSLSSPPFPPPGAIKIPASFRSARKQTYKPWLVSTRNNKKENCRKSLEHPPQAGSRPCCLATILCLQKKKQTSVTISQGREGFALQ